MRKVGGQLEQAWSNRAPRMPIESQMIELLQSDAATFEAETDRVLGEGTGVLDPSEAFFVGGREDLTIR